MGWHDAEQTFVSELKRLTENYSKNVTLYRSPGYDEAAVRVDFLNPFFTALGWDLENRSGVAQSLRDVQIETRVSIDGKKKKADYLFRTNGIERFVFEAKAPNIPLTKKPGTRRKASWVCCSSMPCGMNGQSGIPSA